MIYFVPPEKLYPKLLETLRDNVNHFDKTLIVVPTTPMRERYYEKLSTDLPISKQIGYSIITLNMLIESIIPEQPTIPRPVALIKIKRWLQNLPENHIFSTIAKRVSAPEAILSTLEELEELSELQYPQNLEEQDQLILQALNEAKEVLTNGSVNHRAKHYKEAKEVLRKLGDNIFQSLLSQTIVFVGFYDFSKSQAELIEEYIRLSQKNHHEQKVKLIVPYSNTDYGEYSKRLFKWFYTLSSHSISIEEEPITARIPKRLQSYDGSNETDKWGEPTCYAYQAINEIGEIDALLRAAIDLTHKKNIPYNEIALVLPFLEPYEDIVRDFADYFHLPIRFIEGELILKTKCGERINALMKWLMDLENNSLLLRFFEEMNIDVTHPKFVEALKQSIISSTKSISERLFNLASTSNLKFLHNLLNSLSVLVESKDNLKQFGSNFLSTAQLCFHQNSTNAPIANSLIEIISKAIKWLDDLSEEEYPSYKEWLSLVFNEMCKERLDTNSSQQGIWVGRIHQLRGIPFQLILLPGGGKSYSGAYESNLFTTALKEKWNLYLDYPAFSTYKDSEIEMDWLFAMAVALGENVVVSYPNIELSSGKEVSPNTIFEDYFLSSIKNIDDDISRIVPRRIELVKKVSLSNEERLISIVTKIGSPSISYDFPENVRIPQIQTSSQIGRILPEHITERFQHQCLSPSMLYNFLLCPLRAFFKYFLPIRIIDREETIFRDRGKIIHNIIAKVNADPSNLPPRENWIEFINTELRKLYYPPKEADELEYHLLVFEIIELLDKWMKVRHELKIGVEIQTELTQKITIPLDVNNNHIEVQLTGRIDTVEQINSNASSKEYRIIDWKTGSKPSEKELEISPELTLQLPLYVHFVKTNLNSSSVRAYLVYLKEKIIENCIYEVNESHLQNKVHQAFNLLQQIIESALLGYFPPVPQNFESFNYSACNYCQFQSVCLDRIKQVPIDLKESTEYINHYSVLFGGRDKTIQNDNQLNSNDLDQP
ncbi:MAG: PD-(D/E)XK nuclease family protein [bacterium]|nr:PD-(D/E)XK nuclease family protein [bacterium]